MCGSVYGQIHPGRSPAWRCPTKCLSERHSAGRRRADRPSPTLAAAFSGRCVDRAARWLEARRCCSTDEVLALAAEYGLGFHRARGPSTADGVLAALGRADEGIRLLTTGSGLTGDQSGSPPQAWAQRVWGRLQAWPNRPGALGALGRGTAPRAGKGIGGFWPRHRPTGSVLLAMGDPATAEANYCEAIAIGQQQSAKLRQLRAATSLARLVARPRQAHRGRTKRWLWSTAGSPRASGGPVLARRRRRCSTSWREPVEALPETWRE